jgi:hypothetical protein
MERSEIRERLRGYTDPDCASLHPGYELIAKKDGVIIRECG